MGETGKEVGMLFLGLSFGLAVGPVFPQLPGPLGAVQQYIWILLFVISIALLLKG